MGKSVLFKRLPKILVLQRRVARVQRLRKRRLRVSRSAAVPGEQLGPGGEGKRGGGAGGSHHQQGSEWVSAGWAEHGGRAEQQDRVLLLGLGQDTQRSQTPRITRQTCQSVDMFDNSHYPFNCFNYDGDGYPSSSTDEEKKMCRPAYRYGGLLINLFLFPHFLCISHYTHNHTHKKTYFTFRSSSVFQWDFLSLFTM